jgi:NADPH-dependent 2,4-dienoyl-CoA reductase/sulfur reductase-like enzyme/rhodanese-related sulfurtransferase
MKTVIIGGVAAGMSAATRLRRLREQDEIIVFEMGPNVSYANCGLPYFVSDVISDRDALLLQTPESLWRRFRLEVRTNTRVIAIDRASQTVTAVNGLTGEEFTDSYDYLVLATGARPRTLDVPGGARALALRDVADADRLKAAAGNAKTAVIVGAGFVGVEVAENLRHLGLEVTLVQRQGQILSGFDIEMIEPLQAKLEANGIRLALETQLTSVDEDSVTLASGARIGADIVIAAAGVVPDNALAVAAGLKIGDTGGLWVDEQQRTSDPRILAAGDAVEKLGELSGNQTLIPLANLANRHGRLIADVIAGVETQAHAALGTAIIGAFGMVAAMTGLTEAAARKAGIAATSIHIHPGSHAGYYPGAKRVSLKVTFDPTTGRLLGAQAIGEDGADKRIDVLATAIRAGFTVDDLMDLELAYAPQFGSAKDPINHAGYVGNNVLHGNTPTLQWHELDSALAAGAQLIDVRTATENAAGAIPGARLIPVDELRDHLDQIDGEVIVHCAVGQRGHTATQILRAAGKNVRNLSGGYTTWRAGKDALARRA